jgi:DNA-3-methyladenine glycosylase II
MDPKVIEHFKKADPKLYKVLDQIHKAYGPIPEKEKLNPSEYFNELVESIVSQQLSIKAADTIYGRVKALLPKGQVTPENILKTKSEDLRACGLSNAKVSYVKDLAQKVKDKEVDLERLDTLSNEEVIEELTKIKGIGPWTAEMFLMFSLNREDVFSHGDLGLKNALKKIYSLENPTKDELEKIVLKWCPYRTWGCRILWKSLEIK